MSQTAVILYAFDGTTATDGLSCRVKDEVVILEDCGDWFWCELRGKKGYVPANYCQISEKDKGPSPSGSSKGMSYMNLGSERPAHVDAGSDVKKGDFKRSSDLDKLLKRKQQVADTEVGAHDEDAIRQQQKSTVVPLPPRSKEQIEKEMKASKGNFSQENKAFEVDEQKKQATFERSSDLDRLLKRKQAVADTEVGAHDEDAIRQQQKSTVVPLPPRSKEQIEKEMKASKGSFAQENKTFEADDKKNFQWERSSDLDRLLKRKQAIAEQVENADEDSIRHVQKSTITPPPPRSERDILREIDASKKNFAYEQKPKQVEVEEKKNFQWERSGELDRMLKRKEAVASHEATMDAPPMPTSAPSRPPPPSSAPSRGGSSARPGARPTTTPSAASRVSGASAPRPAVSAPSRPATTTTTPSRTATTTATPTTAAATRGPITRPGPVSKPAASAPARPMLSAARDATKPANKVKHVAEDSDVLFQDKLKARKASLPKVSEPDPEPVKPVPEVVREPVRESEPEPELQKGDEADETAYVVQFDYKSTTDSDITVNAGETVHETGGGDENWICVRTAQGNEGFVPRSYLKKVGEESKEVTDSEFEVVAVYAYDATDDSQLTIKPDESLTVYAESKGWYMGRNEQGQEGLFPVNYVRKA